MAKLTYEMNVDSHYSNFYVIKREGVVFGHIFSLDKPGKKAVWSVWVGLELVAEKTMWNEAWNWIKAREMPEVHAVEGV